jgi:hypothetical protein
LGNYTVSHASLLIITAVFRNFTTGQSPLRLRVSVAAVQKSETMRQVDVDEPNIQKQLGNINMDFVRKAEKRNKERATMHRWPSLPPPPHVDNRGYLGFIVLIFQFCLLATLQ